MKEYNSIRGYLERFSILGVGRLKVRWHKILSADGTPYLHNHPFSYMSAVLKGSYTEQLMVNGDIREYRHSFGSVILRKHTAYHRIKEAKNCRTLFFAFEVPIAWELKKDPRITQNGFTSPTSAGIYVRNINGKKLFCKFDEFWFQGSVNYAKAQAETKLSIHQVQKWEVAHTTDKT